MASAENYFRSSWEFVVKFFKFGLGCLLFFGLVACSSNASKLQARVDKEVGKAQLIEKTRLELDKVLGKKDSVFKASLISYISDKIKVEYNTIVDGRKARVDVVAVLPKMEEVGALILLVSFMPKEKVLNMTVEDVFAELSKNSRKPASVNDIKTETYEFSVNFEKNKDWEVNADQMRRAYTKKNLISKR